MISISLAIVLGVPGILTLKVILFNSSLILSILFSLILPFNAFILSSALNLSSNKLKYLLNNSNNFFFVIEIEVNISFSNFGYFEFLIFYHIQLNYINLLLILLW